MSNSYNKEHHIRWLNKHAYNILCPPCAGKKRPDRLGDSQVKAVILCPKCKRVWAYQIDISQVVIKRKPIWYYTKYQPFIREQDAQTK